MARCWLPFALMALPLLLSVFEVVSAAGTLYCYKCDSSNGIPCGPHMPNVSCSRGKCFHGNTTRGSCGVIPVAGCIKTGDLNFEAGAREEGYDICRTDLCNNQYLTQLENLGLKNCPKAETGEGIVSASTSTFTSTPGLSNQDPSTQPASSLDESEIAFIAVASVFALGLSACLVFIIHRWSRRRRAAALLKSGSPRVYNTAVLHSEVPSCDSGVVMAESCGFGVFQLEERTISREIELCEQIGTGRFGEVYRGVWRGNHVAVKIFKTIEEASFFREVELINTYMLRHDNILGFQAADNRDFDLETQLWMVMDYHCNGSLYDYLRQHCVHGASISRKVLSRDDLHRMALSVSSGLMHLHNHIDGQSFGYKPSIAHRDLKSKNILVKRDGSCCIADFGMAVRDSPSSRTIEYLDTNNLKVGTKRYMAPEVLGETINASSFESFRKVDIYALALVLWEMTYVCCPAEGQMPTYKFPYEEYVPGNPSLEAMHTVVNVDKRRPTLPDHWLEDENLSVLVRIIRTCWKECPQSRFAANRVWRNIDESMGNHTSL